MWPIRKPKTARADKVVKRLVTGLIIGGAIGSVVGKRLLDKHEEELSDETDDTEDTQ